MKITFKTDDPSSLNIIKSELTRLSIPFIEQEEEEKDNGETAEETD